jgi:hypothetical protein
MKAQQKNVKKLKIKDLPAARKGKAVKGGAVVDMFLKLDGLKQ